MRTLLGMIGATVAGSIGWWLGSYLGLTTAFVVSTVASGVGFYLGRRWADENLP